MTALLLDIGNSRIKWGVLDDGSIHRTGHIAHDSIQDQGLAALTSKLPRRVDTVFASNVAGTSFATRLSGVVGMHCDADVRFARSEKAACGVSNSYRQPRRLGVDRWVAMIGAWAELESACLVVDAGTAVTIDALAANGSHLGGQIIPSVGVMAAGQKSGTQIFAGTTAGAVGQGSLNAVVGAVERAARAVRDDQGDATIILTGGDASRILKSLDDEAIHRPHLVLQGLAQLLEHR